MRTTSVFLALLPAALLAAAPLAAQSPGAAASPFAAPFPAWMEAWSPLSLLADLPRRLPGPGSLPELILEPPPRVGLFWTAGHPGALPFEVQQGRTEFRARLAGVSGDYRRPLDPARAGVGGGSALGWRPLGRGGAVAGRADIHQESLDPSSPAHVLGAYGSSPFVVTDTTAPEVRRTRVRLEGAGGWRLGDWGLGVAVGYEALDNRSRGTPLSRTDRSADWGVTGGVVRRLGSRLRLGAYGRWQGWAERLQLYSLGMAGVIHPLAGYVEPEPILIGGGGTPLYLQRIEREAWGLGLAAAGDWAGVAWTLFGEWGHHERAQSTERGDDPPQERWTASGPTLGAAAQSWLASRLLATLELRRSGLEGSGQLPDLTGDVFVANENAFVAVADIRLIPGPARWGGALGLSVRRESRERRDAIVEFGTEIEGWVHSASLEVARWLSDEVLASAAYAGSLYSRTATLPDPATQGPTYQTLIAPELALYAREALTHVGALTLRWWAGGTTSLWVQGRYEQLAPRGSEPALEFAPDGERACWHLSLGVVLGEQ